MKIVTLLSGGIDSVVMLYQLRAWGHDVHPIWFDYQQRGQAEEYRAAFEVCRRLRLDAYAQPVPMFFAKESTPLLQHGPVVPDGPSDDPLQAVTVVPMRNTLFLSFAAALALVRDADAIAYGATDGDTAIYPDCRFDFVCRYRDLLRTATEDKVTIMAPFVEKAKADVVRIGHDLEVPLGVTYSCYRGGAQHCGRCGACSGRRAAFAAAGVPDPTSYLE